MPHGSGDLEESQQPDDDGELQALAEQVGFSPQALKLVRHMLRNIGRYVDSADEAPDGHYTAAHVAQALLRCVRERHGADGRRMLEACGLDRSEALGTLIFRLVDTGLLGANADDAPADFAGLYTPESLDRQLAEVRMPESTDRRARRARYAIPNLLQDHLGLEDITELAVTERVFPYHVRADLQRALDEVLSGDVHIRHFSGVRRQESHYMEGLRFSGLVHRESHDTATAVPPEYEDVDIGGDEKVKCLTNALWLIDHGGMTLAVLAAPRRNARAELAEYSVQIAVPRSENAAQAASHLLARLEAAVRESQSYRGKILSLEQAHVYSGHASGIRVHRLRTVARDQVILPASTLELLERNVLRFVKNCSKLAAYGVNAKKGVLFYGPPGTGKTHTIHYLAHALESHTTFLMSAEQVALLDEYMALVRLLQPSMLVMEDVDLIARERTTMRGPCEETMLNKLLNEMDGLREDAEVLFILTTNRPQMLEPALASRPGRVDQAIEFPMPDEDGRRQLIRLYARDVVLTDDLVAQIAKKTEGVSGAFIKELMRRALQFCLERDGSGNVGLADIDRAIEEMLFRGGSLNRTLLGVGDGGGKSECATES